jgi:hypothetical protein
MLTPFKDFIATLIVEELHPSLQKIIERHPKDNQSKQIELQNQILALTKQGIPTGIAGNMPQGSSRAYIPHEEPKDVNIDGINAPMRVGTKVAIGSKINNHHMSRERALNESAPISLGAMQNRVENYNPMVNKHFRVLTKDSTTGNYATNEGGIFPPLISHDTSNHLSSTIGHVDDINGDEFKKLSTTKDFPSGISHGNFSDVLERHYDKQLGIYWAKSNERENALDELGKHPLVQKFMDYHDATGHPPYDNAQIENLGIFTHPITGKQSIVARDHGFSSAVSHEYSEARVDQNYH